MNFNNVGEHYGKRSKNPARAYCTLTGLKMVLAVKTSDLSMPDCVGDQKNASLALKFEFLYYHLKYFTT